MPHRLVRNAARGLGVTLVFAFSGALFAQPATQGPASGQLESSLPVYRVAERVIASNDHQRRPFLIIDKVNAKVFVFDGAGGFRGAGAALLGLSRGDLVEGDIGSRKIAAIGPRERVTPAGRFHAHLERDAQEQEILLIDYDASIALHPVVKGTPDERRAERLASRTPEDNRITFGCINVPQAFYRDFVHPAFAGTDGYVYILPESGDPEALLGLPGKK